jgi:Right handed beta helix region
MLGRRLRDIPVYLAVAFFLVALPSARVMSAAAPNITVFGVATARTSGSTSLTVPRPQGTAPGALLFAAVNTRLGASQTITAPAGWTLVRRTTNSASGTSMSQATYFHVAGTTEPSSYSWRFSAWSTAVASVTGLNGVDPTTPIDGSTGLVSSNTATVTAPSVTTSQANDALLGVFGTSGGRSLTPPAGMSELFDWGCSGSWSNRVSLEGAFRIQAAPGPSGDQTAVSSASRGNNIGQLVALRPLATPPPQPPPSPDFSLALSAPAATLQPGGTATDTVQVGALNGFSGTVSLSAAGLPSGVTAGFSPASVTGSGSSTFTLTAGASAVPGVYPLTVSGTSGSLSHSASLALTVNPAPAAPDFTLSVTATSVAVQQGASATDSARVGALNGFSGSVSLSASGLPTGVTAAFSPASVSGSGSSTLTLSAAATAPVGTYTVTVTGRSGTLAHSAGLAVSVTANSVQVQGYFVSPSGSDSNPGTLSLPWRTIGHAMAAIQPGDVAYVRSGVYVEGSGNTLDWSRSGVSGRPLTIAAYPGESPQVNTRLKLVGDYLTIKGLGIGPNTHMGNSDVGDVCVWIAGDHDSLVDTQVHGCNMSGVYTTGSNFLIDRNYIHDNGSPTHLEGSQPLDHGIYMGGTGGVASDNLIVRNSGYGIQFWPSCSSCSVLENTIAYNGTAPTGGYGFTFGPGSNNVVANNIIAFNRGDGVHSYNATSGTANTNLVYGNSGPDGSQQYCTGCGGFTVSNPVSGDPLFASSTDFHVQSGSAAVDAALAGYASARALDGVARPMGGGPDLGSYER